uniref:WD repeat-containing protein on Y chromosome-like n=1 Tax=Ciona intestinalis TaxID=7719 RepID=UPI000EF52A61|nr:WD repeat-containing protein on Y chromosome-like [Ciona intestinalis]|eukprot:XP_026692561.1 WD repeat-containing protein on Y chromosome-like [Ciona intestinalis]
MTEQLKLPVIGKKKSSSTLLPPVVGSCCSTRSLGGRRSVESRGSTCATSDGDLDKSLSSTDSLTVEESNQLNRRKKSTIDQSNSIKTNLKMAGKESGKSGKKVDDQMNYEHLQQLEQIFNEGSKGEEGLDMKEFRVAMKKTMGNDIDDTELDMIFMKVDNNCDGTVDWDEYLSYMLLEYQEKKNMFTLDQDCPFPNRLSIKTSNHLESICSVRLLQAFGRANAHGEAEPDDSASRYLTLSREGVLNIWNMDWTLQKSLTLDAAKGMSGQPTNPAGSKGLAVTDMVCMPNCNTVAVASTDYEVSFYSMTSNMVQRRFQIKNLKDCPLTMDYSYNFKKPQNAILLWGDTSGSIVIIRFHENPNLSLFSAPLCPNNQISLKRVLQGSINGLIAARFKNVHTDWVQQVRYFINKKGLECFISGCVKDDTALFFADITEKVTGTGKQRMNVNRRSYFCIRKGVLCLTYDPEWNLIVTGSRDCDVRVWNPYVIAKSSAVLKGHNSAVLNVVVRSFDHQIISVSKDKNVRVWDLRDYSCKQNIHGRNIPLGRLDITAVCFNERYKELVIATNRIGVLHPRASAVTSYSLKQTKSHQKPVARVLFNPLFNQIVTGSEDSMVCLWDIKTGVKQMQFNTGNDVEITCMAFDPTNRRLLIGGRNGAAILWNFNNGAKLRSLEKMDNQEITDVVFTRQRIVTAGWNRHVRIYLDSYGNDQYELLNQTHDDDVLSLDYHKSDSLLASASYDGDVYIWSVDAGEVLMTFNMHISLLPIHREDQVVKKEKKHRVRKLKKPYSTASSASESESKKSRHGRRSATTIGFVVKKDDVWLPSNLPWLKKSKKQWNDKEESVSSDSTFSETESERTHSSNSRSSSRSSANEEIHKKAMQTDRAVYKVLFLQMRQASETCSTLITAGTDGWLSAWSVHQRGGMLGYYHACKKRDRGDFVTFMVSDEKNKVLVTGDSRGYLRVWDIEKYCNEEDVVRRRSIVDSSMEMTSSYASSVYSYQSNCRYLPTDQPPVLKMSVRAHTSAVTSIAYVTNYGMIASGGVDGSVRLWAINGRYIGTFGQPDSWSIDLPIEMSELPVAIPSDVRRVASPTTLRTAKGSVHTQWKQVKNAVNFVNLAGRLNDMNMNTKASKKPIPKAVRVVQEEMVRRNSIEQRLNAVSDRLLEESAPETAMESRQRRGSVTVWMQDIPHSITCKHKSVDQVEQTFQRIKKEGLKSKILGNINYKPKLRHRRHRIDTDIKWCDKHAVIFNSLPFAQLNQPAIPPTPEHMRKENKENARYHFNMAQKKLQLSAAFRRASRQESRPKSKTPDFTKTHDNVITLPPIGGGKEPHRSGELRNEAGHKIVVKKSNISKHRAPSPLASLPVIA